MNRSKQAAALLLLNAAFTMLSSAAEQALAVPLAARVERIEVASALRERRAYRLAAFGLKSKARQSALAVSSSDMAVTPPRRRARRRHNATGAG